MKRFLIALAVLWALCFAVPVQAAGDYDRLIQEGDDLFVQRENMARAKAAAERYRQAVALEPGKADAHWRLARAMYWIGDFGPEKTAEAAFKEGVEAGKKAVALAPRNPSARYWLGINLALYARVTGVVTAMGLVDSIREQMDALIRLDPAFEGGGAYFILGRLSNSLPALLGGSKEKAMAYLEKAVQLGPVRWVNHLSLARVYLDMGREEEASSLLAQILAGSCEKFVEPECRVWKRQAEKLLKKIAANN